MREISHVLFKTTNRQKKNVIDCTVRTDADMADHTTHVADVLEIVWMSQCMTRGLFVVNGIATRGPINGRHVSSKHWLKLV
jgi:hypothetical protein